jgi:hypothetical protein
VSAAPTMSKAATAGVSEACAMPDAAAEIMGEAAAHAMSEAVAEIAVRASIVRFVGIRLSCSWMGSAQRSRRQSDTAHQHDRFERKFAAVIAVSSGTGPADCLDLFKSDPRASICNVPRCRI